jgi:hypothetical protein
MHDYVIIGGGIVGLATAMAVGKKYPKARILVLEKGQDVAQHQTGRNSGVIHSGIYYKPRSLKATFAGEGNRSMVEFCRGHGLKHEVCGKVIVAISARILRCSTACIGGASITSSLLRGSRPNKCRRLSRTSGASLASKFRQRESSITGRFLRNMLN